MPGEVGHWDENLWRAYRRARRKRERTRLLGELIRVNEPLIITLTSQVCGRAPAEHHARRMRNKLRVPYAEEIEWHEALNVGRFAAKKAFEGYDPTKGAFSYYLKIKIYYEIQCVVEKASIVKVGRGNRLSGVDYLEDDDHLARLVGGSEDALDHVVELEDLEELDPAAYMPPEDVGEVRVHLEEPPPPPPAVDRRRALELLLEEHVRFAPLARTAASALRGRYQSLAAARGEAVLRGVLTRALAERGVRGITMRVAWSPRPVQGFAGVSLRPTSVPALPASRAAILRDLEPNPARSLGFGRGGCP